MGRYAKTLQALPLLAGQLLTGHTENSVPPTVTATLVFAQHAQPWQTLPMTFVPVFLLSSYMHLNEYNTDAAGLNAAWSGLYLLLARRRKYSFANKLSPRGIIRGTTMGLCAVNLAGGGLVYALNKRNGEDD